MCVSRAAALLTQAQGFAAADEDLADGGEGWSRRARRMQVARAAATRRTRRKAENVAAWVCAE
jgi:hypothetical protein